MDKNWPAKSLFYNGAQKQLATVLTPQSCLTRRTKRKAKLENFEFNRSLFATMQLSYFSLGKTLEPEQRTFSETLACHEA
jgi:hypothetical protein